MQLSAWIHKSMTGAKKRVSKMTIEECYASFGGDYQNVLSRFRDDARIRRFALLFLKDSSKQELCISMEQGNVEAAFRAAHTLKGVCQNLGFSRLGAVSSEMTEFLRAGRLEEAEKFLMQLQEEYDNVVLALKALDV